jgi:two-component system, LytTR family, response regulator
VGKTFFQEQDVIPLVTATERLATFLTEEPCSKAAPAFNPTDMIARALIVDDEPHARARIRRLLRSERNVEIVGECESGDEVADAIRRLQPDLMFLDIQIRGATAFDVIENVGVENMPVTVFVTAYGEHALAAFDLEAADYLLKPFDRTRFRRALNRGLARLANVRRTGASTPDNTEPAIDWFMLRGTGRELRLLRAHEVDWIEACGNYVFLHVGSQRHLYRQTMAHLESRLDPATFVRIHRSTIVNIHALEALEPIYAGDYEVRLKSGAIVRMSRSYREALEKLAGRAG